jgi:nitrite reductase/ring-hydroxylating ferredoxin subunit
MWHAVARVGDLAPGDLIAIEVDGRAMVLFRDGDRYGCVQRKCIHQGGDLSLGIVSRGHIVCPVHGWRYSATTGVHESSPETCLAMFDVRVTGDAIEVDPTPRRHGTPA